MEAEKRRFKQEKQEAKRLEIDTLSKCPGDGLDCCEAKNLTSNMCSAIPCCHYTEGNCWSAVGTSKCKQNNVCSMQQLDLNELSSKVQLLLRNATGQELRISGDVQTIAAIQKTAKIPGWQHTTPTRKFFKQQSDFKPRPVIFYDISMNEAYARMFVNDALLPRRGNITVHLYDCTERGKSDGQREIEQEDMREVAQEVGQEYVAEVAREIGQEYVAAGEIRQEDVPVSEARPENVAVAKPGEEYVTEYEKAKEEFDKSRAEKKEIDDGFEQKIAQQAEANAKGTLQKLEKTFEDDTRLSDKQDAPEPEDGEEDAVTENELEAGEGEGADEDEDEDDGLPQQRKRALRRRMKRKLKKEKEV